MMLTNRLSENAWGRNRQWLEASCLNRIFHDLLRNHFSMDLGGILR